MAKRIKIRKMEKFQYEKKEIENNLKCCFIIASYTKSKRSYFLQCE